MLRKTVTLRAIAVTAGLMGSAEFVKAQQAETEPAPASSSSAANLPPLEVTSKKAKKKAAKAKAAPKAPPPAAVTQAPVEAEPVNAAPGFPATGVSGPSTPGTQQINVTSQDLARNNPTDARGIFKGEPGIAVGSSVPMSQKIYVHGVEETNLAVTIDGSRQNNKLFHHSGTNLIDPTLMKAVRVDAGVAPADAGPGALGGSIAYETKDAGDLLLPGRNFGGFATAAYDTNGETFTRGVSSFGRVRGFEYLGYLNFADGNNFEGGNGQEILGTGANLFSGLGKVAYQAESGDRLEFSYERVHDDALRPFRANIGAITVGRPVPPVRRYDLLRQNYVLTYTDEKPQGWWNPKAVVGYSGTDLEIPDAQGKSGSMNGKFENRFALAIGEITTGVDFYSDHANYLDADFGTEERADNAGIYVQARLKPWQRTRLSLGLRGDHQWFEGVEGSKFEDSGISANAAGEYDIFHFLTARAGASHVWAGVPLMESFVSDPDWDYENGPESVTADNYTAGLVVRAGGGISLEANVFRTEIDDARATIEGPVESFDLVTEGFDAGIRYEWISGFARAKFARVDAEIDGHAPDTYFGNYLTVPVGDIFALQLVHTFIGTGVTFGADAEFALKNSDPLDYRVNDTAGEAKSAIPAYEVVNAFIEYAPATLPNLTLRADVKNLFDEAYASRATYGQDFVVARPLLEPGRSFRLGATANF